MAEIKRNFLKEFQQQLGLKPDGVIGPKTFAAIKKDLGMESDLILCHLLGQMRHESAEFTAGREDMDYSAASLCRTWPTHFKDPKTQRPNYTAFKLERRPGNIANYIYCDRNGNGDMASGDGWRYRGIFGLQLTGKTNIQAFMKSIDVDPESLPDRMLDNPRNYFLSGKFYFDENHVNELCTNTTDGCILDVSRKINLGTVHTTRKPLGYEQRRLYTRELFATVGLFYK